MGCLHTLLVAFLVRHPMILASPTSVGFQCNPGFTITVSHSALCFHVLSSRNFHATHMALVAFLNCGGRFHNPFYVSLLTLNLEPSGKVKSFYLLRLLPGYLFEKHLHKFLLADGFLCCLSVPLITLYKFEALLGGFLP